MPPRPTLEADDLVTPQRAAELLREPVSTVRVWIHRHGIRPLGKIGRWNAYDYNEIAVIAARMHRARAAA